MSNTVKAGSPILDAISLLNSPDCNLVVVLDELERVVGTITDGDVRRGLLKGVGASDSASRIMNSNPFTAASNLPSEVLRVRARDLQIAAVPIVDVAGRFLRVVKIADGTIQLHSDVRSSTTCAVIMAGGKGLRLRPITKTIPKPMVEVDGRPLLQRIIEQVSAAGITDIFISVNYLAHIIESHFGDGLEYGVNISYLREEKELGTVGSVTNLPTNKYERVLSVNGDIYSDLDFRSLRDYHRSSSASFTICTKTYEVQVPYGVLEHSNGGVVALKEKPTYRYLCNAGIYLFDSALLGLLKKNSLANMTDLIDKALQKNISVNTFPLHEYWSDIGTLHDLQRVRALYPD